MRDEPDQRPSFPAFYESYFVPHVFGPWADILIELAKPRPGEAALDLACGTGIVARRLAPLLGPTGRVVGLDLRPGMIAMAESLPSPGGAPIEWRQGDATSPDLPDESFDLIACQQGLQFFEDRPAALAAARRMLKPGGRIVLSVWQGLDHHPVYEALVAAEMRHLEPLGVTYEEAAAPFLFPGEEDLRRLLGEAGFERIEVASRSMDARFPSIEDFVPKTEYAYAAFMPQFAEDPAAFERFTAAVARDAAPALERHRDGEGLRVPMHAHLALAHRP